MVVCMYTYAHVHSGLCSLSQKVLRTHVVLTLVQRICIDTHCHHGAVRLLGSFLAFESTLRTLTVVEVV